MATLEALRPYLDKNIGLVAHICTDHGMSRKRSPNGQDYGFCDFFVRLSKEPGYYRLEMPDFVTPFDQQREQEPRQNLLLSWAHVRAALAALPTEPGYGYLDINGWRLDVDPNHPRRLRHKEAITG